MRGPSPLTLLLLSLLAATSAAQSFDFFYFVLQWPGSYCDTAKSCCYPTTGKPAADFSIHGLWPNYDSGSYPSNCDPDSPYDPSQIEDLLPQMQQYWPTLACPSSDGNKFWAHEWDKHGTCSELVLNENSYFAAALNLKSQLNVLQALENAGIQPDGGFYSLDSIKDAISEGTGYTPYIECNVDESGNRQLSEVYFCVDTSGSQLIPCPVYPRGKCGREIEFPTF